MHAPNRTWLRPSLAMLPPIIAFGLQWVFWSAIRPYAWLLFLPTVFISSWIGGLIPGLISTVLSATLVSWFFIPPQFSFSGKTPMSLSSIGLFCIMGVLFSIFHDRLRRANQKAEEINASLRTSEENLSVTLSSIGDAVMTTDAQGRVTRLNVIAERLTGWSQAEAITLPVADIFHIINQNTRQPAPNPVEAALAQGIVHGLANDTVLIARDGSEIPIADSCAPIRNRDGLVIGTILVFHDVTREYAAQKALRDSSTRIQTILNTVVEGIISINEQGIIETLNPAAERIFDYSAAEIIGQNVNVLMPEPYHSQHDGFIERYCTTGKAHIIGNSSGREVKGRRRDGSTFPLELAVSEMWLGDRRYFTGSTRDISARKEAENQLDRFFSLSLDMLCISSAEGYFKRVNPAFTLALGWSVEEMLSHPFLFFVHPDDQVATLHEVERQIKAGESVLHFENRYRHKNGSWRLLSWVSKPHTGGLMFATARDITEQRQAEQALIAARDQAELANHAKDSFLATMSHEIRTPLTGMLGMLELLSMSDLDKEQRETLDVAWESGRGLLRIVSDILDWSKIEEGKLELSLRSTSISQLLIEVVNTYSRVASSKSLILKQRLDPRISSAHIVDPLRLAQVLNNFVSNAIKFTEHGEIELRAEFQERCDSDERIRFSVRDTGIGISMAAQQRLFQHYRQERARTQPGCMGVPGWGWRSAGDCRR
ncbi:virulence sensor protein BvgS precursor [mine drainage metagenome]|uniref:histidine kinase n=1 Tax=mine drainage metagenome TaxID=410659 RepID=A0A1J5S356_9ZZZZ